MIKMFKKLREALQGYISYTPVEARFPEYTNYTYTSVQATKCASCGRRKHTPLRIDKMGGYVCLTCIDRKLVELLDFKEDMDNATLHATDEKCADEVHCSCVPILRTRIKELEADNERLKTISDKIIKTLTAQFLPPGA